MREGVVSFFLRVILNVSIREFGKRSKYNYNVTPLHLLLLYVVDKSKQRNSLDLFSEVVSQQSFRVKVSVFQQKVSILLNVSVFLSFVKSKKTVLC